MAAQNVQNSMTELARYFLRLGFLGFGGPVALVGQMERELVNDKKWLTKEQMRESIAICQSCPDRSRFRSASISPGCAAVSGGRGLADGASSCRISLGKIAIGDWPTAAIGIISLAVLFRWKISNPVLIAATAAVGLIAFPLLQPEWVMVK